MVQTAEPSIGWYDGLSMAKNGSGSTNGPQWSFVMDSTAPTASYGAQTPTSDATS